MNYSNKSYAGVHFTPLFTDILESNNTVEKGLVQVIDNIKFEQFVTTLGGDLGGIQAYSSNPVGGSDGITLSDTALRPVRQMVITRFDPSTLIASRFNSEMKAGAAHVETDSFISQVIAYAGPKIGLALETAFWSGVTATAKTAIAAGSATTAQKALIAAQTAGSVEGIISRLVSSGSAIAVVGTTLTASNLKAEFGKVFAAIPSVLMGNSELRIFASKKVKQLILQANQNETYRDVFTVSGDTYAYLGVQIEFVPMPTDNSMTAGIKSDFILGTDLLADWASFEVSKVNAEGDLMFVKAVFSLDSAVCIPSQKVLYC